MNYLLLANYVSRSSQRYTQTSITSGIANVACYIDDKTTGSQLSLLYINLAVCMGEGNSHHNLTTSNIVFQLKI